MTRAIRAVLSCLPLLLPPGAGAQAPPDATSAPSPPGPGAAPPPMVVPRGAPPATTADRDIVVNPPATPAPSGTPLVTPPNLDDPNRPQSR